MKKNPKKQKTMCIVILLSLLLLGRKNITVIYHTEDSTQGTVLEDGFCPEKLKTKLGT